MSRVAILSLLLLLALGMSGCGYSTSSRFDGRKENAETLRFGLARNQIAAPRPGLEFDFSRRLKDEIARDRRFELSSGGGSELEVTLTEFTEPTLVRDLNNVQQEISLSAEAHVRIKRRGQTTRIGQVSAWTSYAPTIGESRNEGLERLWRELSREVLDFVDNRDWLEDAPKEAEKDEKSTSSKEAADTSAKG